MSTDCQPSSGGKGILLRVRGCGNITSFKNSKMLSRGRLITDPTKQKKMESYTRVIESQLRSAYQTAADGMQTGCSLHSWTQRNMPLDDSIQWIPEITIKTVWVPQGEEGADIEITKL